MEIRRLGPDGKFSAQWIVADLLGVLQQLGALPSTIDTGWDTADTTTCDR